MPKRQKILALFMPSKTSFYESLYFSIQKAFQILGFQVVGGCNFLDGNDLDIFIKKYKPSVFFEMNRCKSEIINFPQNILHICWIVDLWGRKLDDIKGSEIIYFFSTQWLKDYIPKHKCITSWLPPASDSELYYKKNIRKKYKCIFLGHIPNPWDKESLNRVVSTNKGKASILFDDILKEFEYKWALQDHIVNNDVYIQEVLQWLEKQNMGILDINEKRLRYDIGCRIIRKGRREFFIDYILENFNFKPFAIFGSLNWKNWEKYKDFFQKELHGGDEMNQVYNETEILIHEGVGLHFRVFDAMMSGTVVLSRKSEQDNLYGGIATIFEENLDYISVDVNKSYDENYMQQFDLSKIAESSRQKCLKNHTWYNRMSKVVKDIYDFN